MAISRSKEKITAIREMSDADLSAEVLKVKKDLFNLRMQKATRQPVKPHEFGVAKHRLGQLMTVEHERSQQQVEKTEQITEEATVQTSAQIAVQEGAE
jgi:large subunit ribosomal protein L29